MSGVIKEAIEHLMSFRDTEITEHNGLKYANRELIQLPEDNPDTFYTKSLASLVELIEKESRNPKINDLIVHVKNPTEVHVVTTLRDHLDRFSLYVAQAEMPEVRLNRFVDLEEMTIMLKSTFVPSEDRETLIQYMGNIREDAIKTSVDDGITQTVTVKTGVQALTNVALPPIVILAPFRTFVEVPQPESEFLLRLQKGPAVALFEADGGAWRIQARKNIKEYFQNELEDLIESEKVIITE